MPVSLELTKNICTRSLFMRTGKGWFKTNSFYQSQIKPASQQVEIYLILAHEPKHIRTMDMLIWSLFCFYFAHRDELWMGVIWHSKILYQQCLVPQISNCNHQSRKRRSTAQLNTLETLVLQAYTVYLNLCVTLTGMFCCYIIIGRVI